ncbi:cell division protein FtsK [Kribbella sp. NPDC055071]
MPDQRRAITRQAITRRAVIVTAALVPGAVALAGCKDDQAASTTPGAVNRTSSGQPAKEATPTVDPAIVAALSTAATQVTALSTAYAGVSRRYPALRAQLAAGAKYHAAHLAKLKETQGVTAAAGKASAVPATAVAALAGLAAQEKAAAIAHTAAAGKVSGEPARLLAMIAAAETQLGMTLAPKKGSR